MEEDNTLEASVIDPSKWDRAVWRGVLYLVDTSLRQAPVFGLIFRHEASAADIFSDWRAMLGQEDENERIRISIVEGDIPRQDYGYTVHITIDPDILAQKAGESENLKAQRLVAISRVFRMNPDRNSRNLPMFKAAYSKIQKFTLIPVIAKGNTMTPTSIKPRMDLGISKKKIIFRQVNDIAKADIDSVVFTQGL
jgi:hypothetical protein